MITMAAGNAPPREAGVPGKARAVCPAPGYVPSHMTGAGAIHREGRKMKTTLIALFAAICLILTAGAAPVDTRQGPDASAESIVFQTRETRTRARTETFSVTLEDFNGPFQAEFLRVTLEAADQGVAWADQRKTRSYPIPAAWDDARYSFLTDHNASVFLACTEAGIWKLYPEAGTAERLSAAAFRGRSIAEIRAQAAGEKNGLDSGQAFVSPLRWIDQAVISPDGAYAAYCSNRSDPASEGNAVWTLDTRTGEELPLLFQNGNRKKLHAFLSPTDLLVEVTESLSGAAKADGTARESRFALVNVLTGKSVPIELPYGEKRVIEDVSARGRAAVTDSGKALRLEKLLENEPCLTRYKGYFPKGARFSPSGRLLIAPVAAREGAAADRLLLVDPSTLAARELDARIALEKAEAIHGFFWIGENALLVASGADSARVRNIDNPTDTPERVVWLYQFA